MTPLIQHIEPVRPYADETPETRVYKRRRDRMNERLRSELEGRQAEQAARSTQAWEGTDAAE